MTGAAPTPTRRQKIIQRTKVGTALGFGVAGVLWVASTPIGATFTVVVAAALSLWSVVEVARMRLFRTALGPTAAALTVALAAVALGLQRGGALRADLPPWAILLGILALAWPGVALAALSGRSRSVLEAEAGANGGRDASLPSFLILPLASLPLFYLVPLHGMGGAKALAAFVGLAKVGDIAGYYVGNAIGKRHPFPGLSPGKTVAGCVGSLVAGTLVGAILGQVGALGEPRYGILSGLLFGALVNVAAQSGDLLESWLKRRAGVKDSGTTFGPSGGMLDLVDSFLLAAPLAAALGPSLFRWSV